MCSAAYEAPFWASLRTLQADSATIGGLWVFDMEDSYLGRWAAAAAAHHTGIRLGRALGGCAELMQPCLCGHRTRPWVAKCCCTRPVYELQHTLPLLLGLL